MSDHRTRRSMARSLLAGMGLVVATGLVVTAGLAAPSAASRAQAGADSAVVQTDKGPVRGVVARDHRSFQGIPYAAPPVGNLRWGSPRPAARWTATREAIRPGNACAQTGGFPGDEPSASEDCLYLNVSTPRPGGGRRLPVMVWIHGDGFFQSSGGIYGAEQLAARGEVVVVTFNYRLGAFGFLTHPALDGGPAEHLSGNFGLEDQQAALRWVRRNAAAFGGDPGNVTIFGESAGGMSVCAHLAAPGSAGLFHRAIIQSGPCTLRWPYTPTWAALPRAERQRQGIALAAQLGCGDPATAAPCLRSKPASELVQPGGAEFGPGPAFGGGGVLPLDPVRAIATGRFNRVPVMHGTTRDEHRTFVAALEQFSGHTTTADDYHNDIEAFFGKAKAAKVRAHYPLNGASPSVALATVWTDYSWSCPALDTDGMTARSVPTYAYEFADQAAPWFRDTPAPGYPTGAYHAAELQYLFSGAYSSGQLSSPQQRLSDQMIDYWATFAHTGNPNGPRTSDWPRFDSGARAVQSLAPNAIRTVDLAREHQCVFWRSLER